MNVTIVDCFDSFTYNLAQLVGSLGAAPVTVTCDHTIEDIKKTSPDRIILSPGPGTPDDAGVCREVVEEYSGKVPILGVCLGHQTIIQAFGGKVVRMDRPVHGKTSVIHHTGTGLFTGLPDPFTATRYHSLMAEPGTLPPELEITASSTQDRCIMGVSHRRMPVHGLQFHPESFMTSHGSRIMSTFLLTGGRP